MRHVIAIVALLVSTQLASAQETELDQSVRSVKLTEISHESAGISRRFFGQVVARQTVDLAFQVGGQLNEFAVLEGQIVPKGDLVAQLDLEPFSLQLQQSQIQLDQAERTVARLERLAGSSVSQVAVDDANTQLDLANLAVRNAQYALDHASLYAPFDALVATRAVANFTTVGIGTPIVRLHDMSEFRIEIDVPEILFQRAGQNPDIHLTATFPGSDEIYPLEIREYDAQASSIGQTFQLTLALPRPGGLAIIPGSSVTVEARLHDEVITPILPTSAIVIGNDGATFAMVFVPSDNQHGVVEKRPVSLVPDRDAMFRVIEGLASGDLVVATGASDLVDGETVQPFTGFAN